LFNRSHSKDRLSEQQNDNYERLPKAVPTDLRHARTAGLRATDRRLSPRSVTSCWRAIIAA